jgi:hypothetical protein
MPLLESFVPTMIEEQWGCHLPQQMDLQPIGPGAQIIAPQQL